MTFLVASGVYHHRSWLGPLLFIEMHKRIMGNEFGRMPVPIKEDSFSQSGYCIDAPDRMPAGGCYFFDIDDGEGLPCQIEIDRGADWRKGEV